MRKTKKISFSALCAALGVIFLSLGSMLDVLDMSAAILSAMLVLFCVIELGGGYASMVYAVVAVLSLVILPNKSAALLFTALFGYMPIIKLYFERRMGRLAWIPKLLIFNLIFALLVFLGAELVGFTVQNAWGIPALVIYAAYFLLANAVAVLCDILFSRLTRVYFFRFRERIRKYLK